MRSVEVVLTVLVVVLFIVGTVIGSIVTRCILQRGWRLPWREKKQPLLVGLDVVSIDNPEPNNVHAHGAANGCLHDAPITANPLSKRSGLPPSRQGSLSGRTLSAKELARGGSAKLSVERLKEHTRSFAISASSSIHGNSNVVAWDDGQGSLTVNSNSGTAPRRVDNDKEASLPSCHPLPSGALSSEQHGGSGDLGLPRAAGNKGSTGRLDQEPSQDALSAGPSTFTVAPASPPATSSPFAVMAGLTPFADVDTPSARNPAALARPLSNMAPVGSLRLPRELGHKNLDISRAFSDAPGLASEVSHRALGLSRLMTFDNPSASRTLDLDTSTLGACLEVHMDEVDLAEQIGKGGFGAVYKGTWRGAPVAVKYGPCAVGDAEALERCLREVVLAKHMSHPNVVQTYAWTLLTGPQANHADNDEDERKTVQRALQNNTAAANAVPKTPLQPANSADLGPSTPRRIRLQELYHGSRSSSGAATPSGPVPPGGGVPATALNQALTAKSATSLGMDPPASPRARTRGSPSLSSTMSGVTARRRESFESPRSPQTMKSTTPFPSPLQRPSQERRKIQLPAGSETFRNWEPAVPMQNRRSSAPAMPLRRSLSMQNMRSMARRKARSLEKGRRKSMDMPALRRALAEGRLAAGEEGGRGDPGSDVGSADDIFRLQSLAGPPGLPPGMHGGMSLPTFIQQSRPPGPYGLSAVPLPPRSGEVLTLDGDSPPRHLPNLNIEVAGGLHTVISHTFSDIGGMNSPGDQLLVASPQPGNAVPPFSRRNPGLAAGSPSGSPRHAPIPNPMTPDSFNRNAGFSLLDGTAPTPQPRTNSRRAPERGPGAARARRRLAYPTSGSDSEDVLGDFADFRPLGLSKLAPRATEPAPTQAAAERQASSNSAHSLTGPEGEEPRSRQVEEVAAWEAASARSPRSGRSRDASPAMSRAQSGTMGATRSSVPLHHLVVSPRRGNLPASPFGGPLAPSSPFQGPIWGHNTPADRLAQRAGSEMGDLEIAARACSMASVRSNGSFNSEEGFGSPSTNKRFKNRHAVPEMTESSFEGGKAVVVVIMEYCDMGTLLRAITKQAFKPHGKWKLHTTYRALLRTAQEVAKGMDYIHSCGIIHGDLKAGNVLLKTHRIDRRGYIAKVADFGLSRSLEANCNHVAVGNQLGTVAYTAPEIFRDSFVTKPSDVYAFGILMWEIYHCAQAFEGMMEGQICLGVCEHALRPDFDDDCPEPYSGLARSCWHQDPQQRPTFQEVVAKLTKIEAEFRRDCHRGRLPPTTRVLHRRATATGSGDRLPSDDPPPSKGQQLRRNVTTPSIIPELQADGLEASSPQPSLSQDQGA